MAENANAGVKSARWRVAPYFIVDDVVTTANFYRDKLGFHYEMLWGDPPRFTIVVRAGTRIMLRQLESSGFMNPNRTPDPEDLVFDAYVWVENGDEVHEEFKRKGVTIARPICDQEYGSREFDIKDCNGYRLCFGQDIEPRRKAPPPGC
jgi:uncharacterized glyoxalase superfamily protein PhnB